MLKQFFLTPIFLVSLAGCDAQKRSNTAAGSGDTATRTSSAHVTSKYTNYNKGGPTDIVVTNGIIKVDGI